MKRALERQINILDYALYSLWRRRWKNFSVMLVFAAMIFLLASFRMVSETLTGEAGRLLANSPEITVQRISAGRQEAIPLDYEARCSAIFGIRKIVPRIWGYYFDEVTGANYTVVGLDIRNMPFGNGQRPVLAGGRLPETGEKGGAAVGHSLARLKGLTDGGMFSLFRPDLTLKPFKVTGVFDPSMDIIAADLMVMDRADARDLFAIPPGMATDLLVYVSNPAEITTIARKISDLLPDTRVLTRPQILKTYQVVFGWRSGFASICLLAALAAFIILAWDKASGLSQEERREIGILKILGWQTADILAVRFWESSLLSLAAFIGGWTMAFIHVAFFDAALFRPVMLGWSVIHPQLRLLPAISLADLLLVFCLSVLPYMAATVIPAWRGATVRADTVLGGT